MAGDQTLKTSNRVAITIISDDDKTDSDAGPWPASSKTSIKPSSKRKLEEDIVDVEEKVEWTEDSDGGYQKLKKRKGKNQSSEKTQLKWKGKGKPRKRDSDQNASSAADPPDELELANIPEYLKSRRRRFELNRQNLREAGLLIPPDYSDVYFSDSERLGSLDEKPKFDSSTGVKPCRPYKDIELEYSAGLIPASIAQYLRDYQIVGVKFLHRLFVYQIGGILGDDMGLGKTVQVAAFLTAAFGKTGDERDAKRMRKMRREGNLWYPRILVICPGSLIQNWKNELNRWGYWHVDLFHGSGKEDVLHTAKAGRLEIMVTTYVTYKNHRSLVNTVEWDAVIADECHLFKERVSETTRAMNEINALCRIGLTGTAIQNKYEELWTLLNWTNPGHFGTLLEWNNTISKPLAVGQSHDATLGQLSLARKTARKLVHNLLPNFFLRRMKTLIADQLPKKTDRVVFCPLTEVQREGYENLLNSDEFEILRTVSDRCLCGSGKKKGWCCDRLLPDDRPWQAFIFPAVMTLQKLSNHATLLIPSSTDLAAKQKSELQTLSTCFPDTWGDFYRNRDSLINLANPEFCGKWKILKKLLRFWHDNGDKVLIFSHSVRLLRVLQHLFHNTSYNVKYLDGALSYEDRQKTVDEFNTDPGQFVFLISTKAGGVGLNITSANKVVIVDPHWNPSYDLQAQDRAYRIGQIRNVDVFRLISAGTIEEIVYARQIYKQQQANIGYNASSERRYFKGVQQDSERKGEIFGLKNLFTFNADQIVLREIVNKTNIAEAKAGINLVDVDMEKVAKDEDLSAIKQEGNDTDETGMSQLAAFLTVENQRDVVDAKKAVKPKSDIIQGILASAGVQYTHENSEVVGSSKVEEQLSRKAEMGTYSDGDLEGDSALFAESHTSKRHQESGDKPTSYLYNPPAEVIKRQFCSMAQEFGFESATEFALVVESWTQEQRRNCLDKFYRIREMRLQDLGAQDSVTEGVSSGDEDEKILSLKGEAVEFEYPKTKREDEVDKIGKISIKRDETMDEAGLRASQEMGNPIKKIEDDETKFKVGMDAQQRDPIFLYDDDDDDDDEL
jgi:DNA excision repair protein ERCC-6-like 2